MCPIYHEDFTPATSQRPKVREKRFLNRIVKGQVLSMNHALFLPHTLEQIRSIVHDKTQRPYLEMDLKLLTGNLDSNIPHHIDRLLELYSYTPFSMIDQINEVELHQGIARLGCGFSSTMASQALWGMEIALSDDDLPFDQLSWGLNYLQKQDYLPTVDSSTLVGSDNGERALVVQLIVALADRLLINQNGSHHQARLHQLTRWPGIEHTVLEQDAFGPLLCGLITNKGIIRYG
jgi:hypothetical protein